ncbi:hypothetical protein Hypma_015020 [Hypsizygus marmoreus]|uniref:Uncharacterized protein n=1 Tax=Hypsizygus marmoreus TaxID=39966 RepID=A0A369K3X8_HYPMA|nr:hypothetical protein Hypma_015020 [Hypsizygus marmoreus]
MSPPSLKGLTPVVIPNRAAKQPPMYTMIDHPQLDTPNKVYVELLDLTEAGMRDALKYEDAGQIPAGDNKDAEKEGFYRMRPGDYVFTRDINGKGDPMDDVLQVWVTGRTHFSPSERSALTDARDECLGPRHERSLAPPIMNSGGMHVSGGLPIEQGQDVKSVKPDTRVYTIANSYQRGAARFSPASGSKMRGGLTENGRLRSGLLKASSALAKRSMEHAPMQVQEELRTHAALVNKPDLGIEGNYAYGTAQLNISVAKRKTQDTEMTDLGFYGKIHRDKLDHCAYFTHMVVHSDLPQDYDPGRFFIYGLGLYVVLENYTCINFSGLRKHGGQAPTAPRNEAPKPWAYRFVVISYPPEMMMNGQAHSVLAALPNKKVFRLVREISNVRTNSNSIPYSECTNWAQDGPIVCDVDAHCKHYGRSLLSSTVYFLNQLPLEYDVQLDSDQFLNAISFVVNGERKSLDSWELAPGWRAANGPSSTESVSPMQHHPLTSQNGTRDAALIRFSVFERRARRHIPYAFLKHKKHLAREARAIEVVVNAGVRGRPALDPLKNRKAGAPGKRKHTTKAPKKSRKRARDDGDNDSEGDEDLPDVSSSDDEDDDDDVSSETTRPHTRSMDGKGKGLSRNGSDSDASSYMGYDTDDDPQSDNEDSWCNSEYSYLSLDGTTLKDFEDQTIAQRKVMDAEEPYVEDRWRMQGLEPMLQTLQSEPPTSWGRDIIVDVSQPPVILQVDSPKAVVVVGNQDVPFLKNICLDILKTEETSVLRTIQALSSRTMHEGYDPMEIAAGMRCICTTPSDENIFNHIQSIWVGLKAMESLEAESKVATILIRRHVMITNYRAWSWLDGDCVRLARSVLEGTPYEHSWISDLVEMVRKIASKSIASCEIKPSDIRSNFAGPTFQYIKSRRVRIIDFHQRVINIFVDVLEVWLGYPKDIYSRQKAQFINVILEDTDMDMLSVEGTWHAYNHLRSAVFCNRKVNVQDPEVFQPLRDQLQRHAVHNPTSRERLCIANIALLLNDVAREGIAGRAVRNRISVAREASFARFAEYLLELVPLLDGTEITKENLTNLQTYAWEDVHTRLPFSRIVAPDMVRTPNPFEKGHCRTNHGVASALIWRGITFASMFASTEKTLFHNRDEWHEALRRHTGQPPGFFIVSDAFGRPNPRRNLDLADIYWASSSMESNPTWQDLTCGGPVSFDNAFRFFMSGSPKRFPQLGYLSAYLLTVDYAHAGVVVSPKADEVALKIFQINRGAAAGLEDLGLITTTSKKEKRTEVEVKDAFLALFAFLETHLTDKVKESIRLEPSMIEYAISKFHTAFKDNVFNT